MADRVSITNKTKATLPRVAFSRIKNAVLGKKYDLSIVFVGDRESQTLNIRHRDGKYVPNVLSFPLDRESGEIFINPFEAKRQARAFGKNMRKMIGYLYIHGLFHLKGLDHGSTMEKSEARIIKQFRLD